MVCVTLFHAPNIVILNLEDVKCLIWSSSLCGIYYSSRPCSPRGHLPRRQLMRMRFAGGVDAHISREENEKYRQLVADNTAWVQQHYRYVSLLVDSKSYLRPRQPPEVFREQGRVLVSILKLYFLGVALP